MFKFFSRLYLLALAGFVQIIAISCSNDNVEPPLLHINQTQVTQQADQEEIINLRRVFADKKYAELLSSLLNTRTFLATNDWNWVPVWEEAVQRGGANYVKYVFVPLEPRHAASPS